MPQNFVNHLQNQSQLELVQTQIKHNQKLMDFASESSFILLYLPPLLDDFPWDFTNLLDIWIKDPNIQKYKSYKPYMDSINTIKNYVTNFKQIKLIFENLVRLKSPYCLMFQGPMLETHYIPLTKESVDRFIVNYMIDQSADLQVIQEIHDIMNKDDDCDLRGYGLDYIDIDRLHNMIWFYQGIRDLPWPNYPRFDNWLKNNADHMYFNNFAEKLANMSLYLPNCTIYGTSNISMPEYVMPYVANLDMNSKPTKSKIYNRYVEPYLIDSTQHNFLLSMARFDRPFYIRPSEYQITDMNLKPCKPSKYYKIKSDTIFCLNKPDGRYNIYLYETKFHTLLKF